MNWPIAGLAVLGVATLAVVGAVVVEQPAPEVPVSEKVAAAYDNRNVATPAPDRMNITIIGDSYVGGSNMGGTNLKGWPALVGAQLPAPETIDVNKSGLGGSGYVKRGPTGKLFGEVIPTVAGPKTDVVVFFGSINDRGSSPDQVGQAAAGAYAEAKAAAPQAKLLVIGPAWTSANVPADLLAIRDSLEQAATTAGAAWVDPINEGWFFDQPALIGADKVHPTDEGHAYMGRLILPHLTGAVEGSAKG
jgi:lysophospholipase L1-like esterase